VPSATEEWNYARRDQRDRLEKKPRRSFGLKDSERRPLCVVREGAGKGPGQEPLPRVQSKRERGRTSNSWNKEGDIFSPRRTQKDESIIDCNCCRMKEGEGSSLGHTFSRVSLSGPAVVKVRSLSSQAGNERRDHRKRKTSSSNV